MLRRIRLVANLKLPACCSQEEEALLLDPRLVAVVSFLAIVDPYLVFLNF